MDTLSLFARQQLVDTLALFDQHRGHSRDQAPTMAELRHRVSELEFELRRRKSLESEVAWLNKLLAERELELAKSDKAVIDAELR